MPSMPALILSKPLVMHPASLSSPVRPHPVQTVSYEGGLSPPPICLKKLVHFDSTASILRMYDELEAELVTIADKVCAS